MMDHRQQTKAILFFNNQGATLFEHGDIRGAIRDLSEAFRASKELFHSTSVDYLNNQLVDDGDTQSSYPLMEHLFAQSRHQPQHHEVKDFVYERAICLPDIPSDMIVSSSSMKLALLAITLFNLALAHQVAGRMVISDTTSSKYWLNKAATLYEHAYRLQRTEQARSKSSPLYLMVVLNNLGQVYRLQGNATHADECFSQLLSMTMCVMNRQQQRDEQRERLHWVGSFMEGFMKSSSHLILKDGGCAAAAA